MVVVSVDPVTGATAMFSISRNIMRTPLPPDQPYSNWWGDTCPGCYPQALNLMYGDGANRPDIWGGPNAGANAVKTSLGYMLGLEIHYYLLVDLDAFITIIDAIGGLEIYAPERVELGVLLDEGWVVTGVVEAGLQQMDGATALAYSRTRPDSDFERQNRQRCVLQALAAQTDPVTAIREFPSLVPVLQENLRTDIRMSDVPDFLELLGKFDPAALVSTRIMPDAPEFAGTELSYMSGWTEDGFPIPDREFIAERVALILDAQATVTATGATGGSSEPSDAAELAGLQPITDICGPTAGG
jgi:LCP family protein required for cell wall assembly